MKKIVAAAITLLIISCNNSTDRSPGVTDSITTGTDSNSGATISPGTPQGQDTTGINMDRTRNDSGMRK